MHDSLCHYRHRRTSRPWTGRDYCLFTNILGAAVELQVTHLASGHRFISRADDFEIAVCELDRMVCADMALVGAQTRHLSATVWIDLFIRNSKKLLSRLASVRSI
jgi:hypothetical protein